MNISRRLSSFIASSFKRTDRIAELQCLPIVRRILVRTMSSAPSAVVNGLSHDDEQYHSYEKAIEALQNLPTNVTAFAVAASRPHRDDNTSKVETIDYLLKSGISLEQLDTLSVIHVAGTKGKGSTCAITESILRSYGVRTGFYSSPHLVEETERFRLNGRPISRHKFAKYFWRVYNSLEQKKNNEADMPAYFMFFTVMAFHVFLGESVDVVILEVGIGGEHDCTNIVRNTKTAGISALGFDHTSMLGNTLTEIAWQKSGIIKTGCNVFTSPQSTECRDMLQSRSDEKQAHLKWVPDLSEYTWNGHPPEITHLAHKLNGSLAIQLAYDWMKSNPNKVNSPDVVKCLQRSDDMCTEIFDEVQIGIEQCQWPGRFQETKLDNIRYFIDGSHTLESLKICIDWFKQKTSSKSSRNVLVFNVTGNRDAVQMLTMLQSSIPFELAAFTPNVARKQTNYSTNLKAQHQYCRDWASIVDAQSNPNVVCDAKVFDSLEDVFQYVDERFAGDRHNVNVLVTGSLYLVGAVTEWMETRRQ